MHARQYDNYHKLLIEKQDVLKKRLAVLQSEDPFADPERTTDNAAVDAEAAEQFGHERVVAMKAEIDDSLRRISRALEKINDGTFGICEGCGKEILEKRLRIDPAVRLCVECEKNHVTIEE